MYLPLLWNMRIRRFRGYESTWADRVGIALPEAELTEEQKRERNNGSC